MQAYPETTPQCDSLKPCQILMLGSSTPSAEIVDALRLQHNVVTGDLAILVSTQMRALLSTANIVVVDFTTVTAGSLKLLDQLNAQIGITNLWPRLLCFSSVHRNPRFVLEAEKCGARYVRVENISVLVEAIRSGWKQ